MKKNNKFVKLVFLFGAAMFMFSYLKMRVPGSGDIRTNIQAVHTCSANTAYTCSGACDAGYTCNNIDYYTCYCAKKIVPTATTAPCCDIDGNRECTNAYPYECVIQGCESCTNSNTVKARTKYGYCHSSCCTVHCSTFSGIPDSINCGWCPATNLTPPVATPTQITAVCQPYSCANMCGFSDCSDNCGSQTGCVDGHSCSPCPGTIVNPTSVALTPTVNPGCSPTCENDSCRTNTCSDTTCLGTCGGNCIGALTCYTPSLDELIINNADSTSVSKDASNRNHICETSFSNSSNPRRVIFKASVVDLNGFSDITTVVLRWNGNNYNMVYDSGADMYAIYVATVDFASGDNATGTYPLQINITDSHGKTTDWVDTGRNFKVWDCQVPVSGNIYDGSGGQACDSIGFSNLVDSSFNLKTLLFRNATAGLGVSATVTEPNHFGSNNLIWANTYLPIFNGGSVANPNGDLWGSGRITRIVDLGTGVTSCPLTDEFAVSSSISAYSTNVGAALDLSFIRTQDGWFQVAGAGVKAKNQLSSGVPATAPAASRALSISKILADNGLVSFSTYSNINGLSDNSAYGLTNNWWVGRNTNDSVAYNYQYFYNNLYIARDLGTTGTDWLGKPSEGVYFVNGNLTIDSDFALASGKTLLVVVRGSITIANTVNRVDGIYIADGGITATGTSATQLVINGLLYSRGNIRIARSYATALDNNSAPAVKINYQPNLVFNLPGTVMRVLSGWRQE